MRFTTIRIERPEGTVIAAGIVAQIDLAAIDPHDDLAHDRDFVLWDVYVEWSASVVIQRRDVLVDEGTIDPLTAANVRLRVTGVEVFDTDHTEARCEQIIGS